MRSLSVIQEYQGKAIIVDTQNFCLHQGGIVALSTLHEPEMDCVLFGFTAGTQARAFMITFHR